MNRILGFAALLGFTLSLVVHVAALLGIDVAAKLPLVWALHLGVFVVFLPFAFLSRKVLGTKPSFAQIKEHFPGWVVALGVVIMAYVAVNFLRFVVATQGGSPSIQDGKFVLQSHGKLIGEITASEYTAFKANEVRGFSGHWLVFYFVPFAYFIFCRKPETSPLPKPADDDAGQAAPVTKHKALDMLAMALQAHDLPFERQADGQLVLNNGGLRFSAGVFERNRHADRVLVALEIHASAPVLGTGIIVECFAGLGPDLDAAIGNAFGKFLAGSFHVIVEALAPHTCDSDTVEIQVWAGEGRQWSVYSGALLSQYSSKPMFVPDYPALLRKLKARFEESADTGPHWIRVFIAGFQSKLQAGEVLLDNEHWEGGERDLQDLDWETVDEYQTLRHFMLMIPRES
jgi:hypothetical protein